MKSTSRLTALGVAAAAATLAACGGGSTPNGSGAAPSGNPTQVVAAAATATQSAGTARVDMVLGADFSGLPGQNASGIKINATGAFDLGKRRASLDMDLGSLGGGRRIKAFVDGTTAYVNTSGLGLTGSKPWIRVDTPTSAAGFGSITSTAFSGPKLLSQMSNVSAVGTETLHGASTTHYRGTLNLGAALNQLGGGGGGISQLGPSAQSALAGTAIPLDVWIDGQNRLRRFSVTMDLAPILKSALGQLTAGSGGTFPSNTKAVISLDFSLYDFGAALNLTPPPADQIGPAPPGFTLPGGTSV